MSGKREGDVRPYLPFIVFVLAPLIVFPRAMFKAGMMDGGDDKLANLPLLLHSARKLLHGEIFWTSDLWMGMPLLAEPESATFYLPRLLLLLFPPATGYVVYVLLHFVLAQIGAYLYLRLLELDRGPATVGAFVYGFAGFMLGHAGHTMYVVAGAWAPLFLYFLHRATLGKGRPVTSALGASLAFSACLFAGAVQLSVYLLTVAGLVHLALSVTTKSLRPLWVYVAFATPAVLVTAPQLLASWDYAQTLAGATREDYAFATQLSFHPLLLPTLFAPIGRQGSAELHSRIGIAVAGVAALGAMTYRAKPIVRAWSLVALVAAVLMLGRFVPPVARLLHALPIASVLRGPVRHNFELGIAVAVLAAYGTDALMKKAPRSDRRALIVAAVLSVISIAIVWGTRANKIQFEHRLLYVDLPKAHVRIMLFEAILALAGWFAVRRLARGPWVRLVPAAMLLLAVFETTASEDSGAGFWAGLVRPGVPRELPGTKGFTRVLPPHIEHASYPTVPGNAVLYLPGVQSLLGYSSIAPTDSVTVLDLDMHGHARHRDDLVWSRLPAVFGVTHVMMPMVSCNTPPFGIDPALAVDAACTHGASSPFGVGKGERRCAIDLGEGRRRYRIDAEIRTLAPRTKPVIIGVWSPMEERQNVQIVIPPSQLGTTFAHFGGEVDLGRFNRVAWLGGYTDDSVPVEVRNLRFSSASLVPVTDLVSDVELTLKGNADQLDDRITLPTGSSVERRIDLPADEPELGFRLEALALKREGTPRLVIDLYDGPGFDPEDAQLTLEPELDTKPRLFSTDFRLGRDRPPTALFRAYIDGKGFAEIYRARLFSEKRTSVMVLNAKEAVRGDHFHVSKDLLQLGALGGAMVSLELPTRPMLIDVELAGANDGIVGVGLATRADGFSDDSEITFAPGTLTHGVHARRAVSLRADAVDAFLRIYNKGNVPVQVASLAARDACAIAHYEPVRPLDGGWWLHRTVDALPRVYAVGQVVPIATVEEARDRLRNSTTLDAKETALVQTDGAKLPEGLRRGNIEAPRFSAERIEMWVDADSGPTFLVINEHYDARFRATVDGVQTPIFRTNGLVRGLVVPQGRHRVVMTYEPPQIVYVGFALAGLGLLLAIFAVPKLFEKLPPPS
ncbi:MAG: hypothetical protein ACXVEE_07305 [Polyangiales bacterium]